MRRTRPAPVTPLLFLLLLLVVPGCLRYMRRQKYPGGQKLPAACHQTGPLYEITVDENNRVSNDPACFQRKQTIRWKRPGGQKAFRIEFLDPRTPIMPLVQDCKNECKAEILPEAEAGTQWTYAVTDAATGQKYDPVIIIVNCCTP
jgi:hypothetical protein